jgi:hypothetical protein
VRLTAEELADFAITASECPGGATERLMAHITAVTAECEALHPAAVALRIAGLEEELDRLRDAFVAARRDHQADRAETFCARDVAEAAARSAIIERDRALKSLASAREMIADISRLTAAAGADHDRNPVDRVRQLTEGKLIDGIRERIVQLCDRRRAAESELREVNRKIAEREQVLASIERFDEISARIVTTEI